MEDKRLKELHELFIRLADGEYEAGGEPSSSLDDIDGLMVAANMLGETLGEERRAREAAEALLEDERQGYQESPGLLASVELSFRILACNKTFANTVGCDRKGMVGTARCAFHPEEERQKIRVFLPAVAAGEDPP